MSVIEIKNLSKKYYLNERNDFTLCESLQNLTNISFKSAQQNKKKERNAFFALKNICFNVNKNEVVGIIGSNGAGKSTLLKIISQITPPTSGIVKIKGKVASLLEVGTGFHPELTGRENIYLNGAILGMTKNEINKKFNDIVQFSEIEKFLDMPIKRYSSGMYVRLAFSVAAHMDPDILIVDEVLSVGDVRFQKKCLGKMNEITKEFNRTILFVSHNMDAIMDLCNRCILLDAGKVRMIGKTSEVIDRYLNYDNENTSKYIPDFKHIKGSQNIIISKVFLYNKEKIEINSFNINEPIMAHLKFKKKKKDNKKICKIHSFILIHDSRGKVILSSFQKDNNNNPMFNFNDVNEVKVEISPNILMPGKYHISAGIFDEYNNFEDWVDSVDSFRVKTRYKDGNNFDNRLGVISQKFKFKIIN